MPGDSGDSAETTARAAARESGPMSGRQIGFGDEVKSFVRMRASQPVTRAHRYGTPVRACRSIAGPLTVCRPSLTACIDGPAVPDVVLI